MTKFFWTSLNYVMNIFLQDCLNEFHISGAEEQFESFRFFNWFWDFENILSSQLKLISPYWNQLNFGKKYWKWMKIEFEYPWIFIEIMIWKKLNIIHDFMKFNLNIILFQLNRNKIGIKILSNRNQINIDLKFKSIKMEKNPKLNWNFN